MDREQIAGEVYKVIETTVGFSVYVFSEDMSLDYDLCLDELEKDEIRGHIEEVFNISISDEELDRFYTVKDIIEFVEGEVK